MREVVETVSYGPAWIGAVVFVLLVAGAVWYFRKPVSAKVGEVREDLMAKVDEYRS